MIDKIIWKIETKWNEKDEYNQFFLICHWIYKNWNNSVWSSFHEREISFVKRKSCLCKIFSKWNIFWEECRLRGLKAKEVWKFGRI